MINWHSVINDSFKTGKSTAEMLEEAYQLGRSDAIRELLRVIIKFFKERGIDYDTDK